MATVTLHAPVRAEAPRPATWVGMGVIVAAVVVVELVGVGVARSAASATWHPGVVSAASPPGWVFGPAWTGLLALLAAGASVVWLSRARAAAPAALPACGWPDERPRRRHRAKRVPWWH